MDKILDEQLEELKGLEEDYPGQLKESRRYKILERAVDLADGILVDYSDGEVEELDWLTARVAESFLSRVVVRLQSSMLRKDMEEWMKK